MSRAENSLWIPHALAGMGSEHIRRAIREAYLSAKEESFYRAVSSPDTFIGYLKKDVSPLYGEDVTCHFLVVPFKRSCLQSVAKGGISEIPVETVFLIQEMDLEAMITERNPKKMFSRGPKQTIIPDSEEYIFVDWCIRDQWDEQYTPNRIIKSLHLPKQYIIVDQGKRDGR